MSGQTERKLAEASYFLGQMEATYNVPKVFDFNLSAFVSAARSVLWIMRSEYSDSAEWEAWFRAKTPNPEEKQFIKAISDIRNRSLKSAPLETRAIAELLIPSEYLTGELKKALQNKTGNRMRLELRSLSEAKDAFTVVDDNELQFVAKVGRAYLRIEDFPEDDILDISKRYYLLLEALVRECNERF